MQHVENQWLKKLTWGYAGFAAVLIAMYVGSRFFNVFTEVTKDTGITGVIIGFCIAQLLYTGLIFPILIKKNPWAASLVSYVIILTTTIALIQTSASTNNIWHMLLILLSFIAAMYGTFTLIAVTGLIWILFVFTVTSILTPTELSLPVYFLINSSYTAAGFMGWLSLKNRYTGDDGAPAAALKNMLAQEQFKSTIILESISDGVLVMSTKGTVQLLNQSAATMLGWAQSEAANLDYRSLIQPEAENAEAAEADAITLSQQTGASKQKVSLLQTHHGRHIYVDIVASPITQTVHTETGEEQQKIVGTIAVLRDVDKQRRTEQQRSDFISTASHEMRTPVAAIQGFLELALNPKVSTVDDKAKVYLTKAYDSTKRLGTLFQDLLTVSKSDDGRLTNNPKLIEVNEFLSQIIEEDRMAAEKKGLKVALESDGNTQKTIVPLLYINVDPDRLREVISNLFDNAMKYTKSGMITLGASLKERGVVIRISDTGAGIAEEDIPHLFQKFYRTDNSATREIGGTGLGLYICKEIVEMMGGRIYVESTIGTGSTFFVELPRVSDDVVARIQDSQSEQTTPPPVLSSRT